jgi:hypothetical protein
MFINLQDIQQNCFGAVAVMFLPHTAATTAASLLCCGVQCRGIATPRLGRAMVGRHTVRVILHYNNQQ